MAQNKLEGATEAFVCPRVTPATPVGPLFASQRGRVRAGGGVVLGVTPNDNPPPTLPWTIILYVAVSSYDIPGDSTVWNPLPTPLSTPGDPSLVGYVKTEIQFVFFLWRCGCWGVGGPPLVAVFFVSPVLKRMAPVSHRAARIPLFSLRLLFFFFSAPVFLLTSLRRQNSEPFVFVPPKGFFLFCPQDHSKSQ